MKKHVVKNSRFPVVLVASFFLLILAGFLYSKPFKVPKEVEAVVGTLNLNTTGSTFVPGGIWKSDGSVGIGNTNPQTKFDVTGTGRFSSTLTASSGLTLSAGTLSLPANSITDAMVSNTLTASTATTATTANNALLLDSIDSTSFLRSDANDTFTGKLSVPTANRSGGIYGTYDSYKIGHIWSMGTAYSIADDGSTFGTPNNALYGMAYCHTNNANCKPGYGHQIDITQNGVIGIALGMGGGAWFGSTVTAPTFSGNLSGGTVSGSTFSIGSITGDGMIENTRGGYTHIGNWGVARTAADAVLVNTAYMSDRLSTARTIWGQSFNGSAAISGALSGATTGSFSSTVTAPTFSGNLSGNQSGGTVNATTGAFSGNVTFPGSGIWNSSGNVGIGTASPTLGKLQVNGGSGVAIRSDSSGPNATIYGVNSSVSGVGVTGYGSANGGIGVYGLGTGNGWDFYGAGPKSYFAGTVTASGVINASGGNSTQWNAASTGYGAVKVALVQNSAATTCQSRCATKYGSTWGCSVATAWAGGTNPAIGASYISCSDTTTTYKICTCFNFDYSL